MTTVLLVDKLGTLKPLKIKEYNEEDFYKKCGYKSSANFKLQHTWNTCVKDTNYFVHLFAKSDVNHSIGENKYKFPPPVDSVLYFGTCLLTASLQPHPQTQPQPVVSLTEELWNQIYNRLCGGVEKVAEVVGVPATVIASASATTTTEPIVTAEAVNSKPKRGGTSKGRNTKARTTTTSKGTKGEMQMGLPSSVGGQIINSATKSPLYEDDPSDEAEEFEESTVCTDIDEDDDDDTMASEGGSSGGGGSGGGRGGGKRKRTAAASSKKKDSQKEITAVSMEATIQELLRTEELKEEPYVQ